MACDQSLAKRAPNHCMQPRPSQSSNLHTQICCLSGARLMLAVSLLMDSAGHPQILKRAGVVLLVVGLLDIGVMIYCIANSISYSSSFNIFAVIAGIFLLRGSLRAALVVRWLSMLMLAAFLTLILAWPLVQP